MSRLDQTVSDRIRDTFVWAVYPEQFDPTKPFELVADKVPTPVAVPWPSASAPSSGARGSARHRLRRADPRGDHITNSEPSGATPARSPSASCGATSPATPTCTRLVRREVLDNAIEQSLSAVLVDNERFAIASGKDAETGRYRSLLVAPNPNTRIQITDSTCSSKLSAPRKQPMPTQSLPRVRTR